MKSTNIFKKNLLILFMISLGIRVLFCFILVGSFDFTIEKAYSFYPDSKTYIIPADSLLSDLQFLNESGKAEILRTPGYPMFLAVFKTIFGSSWVEFVIIAQNALNIFAVLMLYILLYHLSGNNKAAFIGGCIAAMNIHDIYFACFILSDSLFQSILWISISLFVIFLTSEKKHYLLESMILLMIGIFVRPVGMYLPVCLGIGALLYFLIKQKKQKAFYSLFIILFVCYIPVLMWQFRNRSLTGFSGFSAISSHNLYYYHVAGINAVKNNTDFYSEQNLLKNNFPTVLTERAQPSWVIESDLAKETILSNLPVYTLLTVQGMGLVLFYPGVFDILRLKPDGLDFIEKIKQSFILGGIKPALQALLNNPAGILTIINCAFLVLFFGGMIYGLIASLKYSGFFNISILTMLGVFLYFLVINSGPYGFGAYPRFRLSFSFIQTFLISQCILFRRKSLHKLS